MKNSKPRLAANAIVHSARSYEHPVARYNDNPLIRALRPLEDAETMMARLTTLPKYEETERQDSRSTRVLNLLQLTSFYIGFPRVVELHETVYGMICEGYLARMPYSPEDIARRQALLDMVEDEISFSDLDATDSNGAEFSAALIGIPGIGKSKAVKKVTAPYRRVIYHADLDIYQIPALLIEMPYKGTSINVLAHAIIRAIDKLLPQAGYFDLYLKGRTNAEILFMDAVNLMQIHYVGILVVDEAQNRDYQSRNRSAATTGQAPLITLLITATNQSNVPILMTGTPELHDLTGSRMSMVRRLVGRGMQLWKPLSLPRSNASGEVIDMGEFDVFLSLLWTFQWTKMPFELTPRMRNLFYFYTQGISDVIIKLFHDVQLRAIRSGGDEIVDEALIADVANNELKQLTTLTSAMRELDYDRVGQAVDLAAFLRFDPSQLTLNRKQADGTAEEEAEAAAEEPNEELADAADMVLPPEAFEEASEVPIGPNAKRRRAPRKPKAPKSVPAPVDPVSDFSGALDE